MKAIRLLHLLTFLIIAGTECSWANEKSKEYVSGSDFSNLVYTDKKANDFISLACKVAVSKITKTMSYSISSKCFDLIKESSAKALISEENGIVSIGVGGVVLVKDHTKSAAVKIIAGESTKIVKVVSLDSAGDDTAVLNEAYQILLFKGNIQGDVIPSKVFESEKGDKPVKVLIKNKVIQSFDSKGNILYEYEI